MRLFVFSAVLIATSVLLFLTPGGEADESSKAPRSKVVSLRVDSKPIDRSASLNRASYADVLSKATPAVVGVYTSKIIRFRSNPQLNPVEEFLRRYYGLSPSGSSSSRIEQEKVPAGIGSGVIVSDEGHVLTNAHVITDQRTGETIDEVIVKLADKREIIATIIGLDKATDVAVLQINAPNLPRISLSDSDQLRVGDIVFAAGNPLGVGLTVTMGIVSATGRTNLGILDEPGSYEHFIQTDAAINMGNSGGALLDSEGRLAGINTAIYSRTGGNIGIGFAIPINLAKSILVSLVEKGNVDRGFLGVNLEDIDSETAAKLNLPSSSGARVNSVVPGSPADDAGLRENDVIVSLGDQPVRSVAELRVFISRTPPGEPIRLGWFREGRRKSFEIKLGRLGDKTMSDASPPLPGLTLQPLSADLRSRFDVPRAVSGLVVTNSLGTVRSLREGVVIIEINGTSVSTLEEANRLVERGLNRLYVWFRGNYSFVPYRLP
ncbi:MAG: trypsin-like peptidase domain-containing protein [Opitutales bacterium]